MEKITVLGTGTATVLDNYNTCFTLSNSDEHFLIDAGGGNRILKQLRDAKINISRIHHIFISHRHIDHILGIVWLFREVNIKMTKGIYEGKLHIYCHKEVAEIIRNMVTTLLRTSQQKYLDDRIFIDIIKDGEIVDILGYKIEFFDIHSKSDLQFGFTTELMNKKKLVFAGDEPLDERNYKKVENADYLFHEAYSLEREIEKYEPYKKNHDTVESASRKASKLNVKNLVLWHVHENLGKERRKEYTKASKKYFNGNIIVPDDFDIIEL